MELKIGKSDWLFLLSCLLLGILAEESFFRAEIGISYLVFTVAFYSVFFWRYRNYSFSHQRFGYLLLSCIWILSASYFINDNMLFYSLNILVIPGLVIFHLVLVTSPKNNKWNHPIFILYILLRLIEALKYNVVFAGIFGKSVKQGIDEKKFMVWKKVLIGFLISVPVLFVVLRLLMSADLEFERIIGGLPLWLQVVDAETVMRFIVILIYTFAFFGLMQVLVKKQIKAFQQTESLQPFRIDTIIAITVLVLVNAVYLLFTVVQFTYFFSGTLQGDFTYAEYARQGFFELLFVTLINLSITIIVLSFVEKGTGFIKRFLQILLTILVLSSGVMLVSAFLRLSMYEDAYGFTFTRVLVHSFMIFLAVIFTYTFVKIWIEKLSLFHFYFIASLLYYTAINIINLDQIVVNENINRYEHSGKIDLHYLNQFSSTGLLGLIDLYQKDKEVPGLKEILQERKESFNYENSHWQSYHLKKTQVKEELKKLQIN